MSFFHMFFLVFVVFVVSAVFAMSEIPYRIVRSISMLNRWVVYALDLLVFGLLVWALGMDSSFVTWLVWLLMGPFVIVFMMYVDRDKSIIGERIKALK